jgi:hypothetical protein
MHTKKTKKLNDWSERFVLFLQKNWILSVSHQNKGKYVRKCFLFSDKGLNSMGNKQSQFFLKNRQNEYFFAPEFFISLGDQ